MTPLERRAYNLQYRKKADAKYRATDNGKAVQKKADAKYRATDDGKAAQKKADAKYRATDDGKAVRKKANAKYRATDNGKGNKRARRYKARFEITIAQYDWILNRQNGGCALCGHPPKARLLAVDHDSRDGRVRGLLCFTCNYWRVGKHNAESARALLAYVDTDFDGRLVPGGDV